jgi:hypothetical protein
MKNFFEKKKKKKIRIYGFLGCYVFFSRYVFLDRALAPLAHNDTAAWRSGGFHYQFCGARQFNFARKVHACFRRRCAKPLVVLSLTARL